MPATVYLFFEDPESLSAQSWDRFMTRSRCRKPGLRRLPDSAMSGRSAKNDSSLHQPRSFDSHGKHPGRRPRNAEVTAGEMEEGVGLKAVSELLWPDRDREVPGFPVTRHPLREAMCGFLRGKPHAVRWPHKAPQEIRVRSTPIANCPRVMTFVCGVRLGLAQAGGAECRQARPPTLICRRAGEAVRVRRGPTATAARARSG
jgi:hypothetical protein